MKFVVRITKVRTDDYKTFVEADDEDEAKEKVLVSLDGLQAATDIRALEIDGGVVAVEYTCGLFHFEVDVEAAESDDGGVTKA